jgi:hypothetical protein
MLHGRRPACRAERQRGACLRAQSHARRQAGREDAWAPRDSTAPPRAVRSCAPRSAVLRGLPVRPSQPKRLLRRSRLRAAARLPAGRQARRQATLLGSADLTARDAESIRAPAFLRQRITKGAPGLATVKSGCARTEPGGAAASSGRNEALRGPACLPPHRPCSMMLHGRQVARSRPCSMMLHGPQRSVGEVNTPPARFRVTFGRPKHALL